MIPRCKLDAMDVSVFAPVSKTNVYVMLKCLSNTGMKRGSDTGVPAGLFAEGS
tara:strand:+ start:210 stop:368 length:159 start_codon:yes stop_codon:yes gene_type:complete